MSFCFVCFLLLQFAVVKKSLYREECSTKVTTQLGALSCDDYWKADDYVHQSGHQPSIFPDNPCHQGYIFAGIDIEGERTTTYVGHGPLSCVIELCNNYITLWTMSHACMSTYVCTMKVCT